MDNLINQQNVIIKVDNQKELNKNPEKAKEIWKNCLDIIRQNINGLSFKTWFEPIEPLSFDNNELTIKLPNDISWEYIEVNFNGLIKKALLTTIGSNAKLKYLYDTENKNQLLEEDEFKTSVTDNSFFNSKFEKAAREIKWNINRNQEEENFETNLNEKFTFDNFIKGEGNQLALAAAIAVAEQPGGTSFNPLFIYGGVGLGKTHLIQAIGNHIVKNKKVKKVLYTTAEKFTTEFVESIKKGNTNEFTAFYRKVDILIIDDIQFLSGKESTTDTFFHIFNSLYHLGKQIVLSSDKPPKNLSGIDERLISRFQWGLSVDIQPPDLETRIAILIKKSEAFNLDIDLRIIEYIATNITNNIRELEGALIKLLAKASLEGKEITLDLAREVVKEVATDKRPTLTIDQIQNIVAEYFGFSSDMLRSKTKKKEYVQARQIAMYFCKKFTNSSLKTIGLNFGGRDHTTVIHALQTIEEQMKDNSFVEMLSTIQRKIEYRS
ncbi:MAG: chromosomal replication initiator protein DnaA [Ignavibacterium sp.]|nr:chromosomal replication initiator protein DnaA [Ignavibacterium sp.]